MMASATSIANVTATLAPNAQIRMISQIVTARSLAFSSDWIEALGAPEQ
jgi:hypothetical protein